jgi:hypothetical protein
VLKVTVAYSLVYTHTHARVRTRTRTRARARSHTHRHAHKHTRTRTHTGTRTHTRTRARTHTHTHARARTRTHARPRALFGRASLYEGSAPRNALHSLENIYSTGRIRTRIASNQAAAHLRLRPRGHRNWRLWVYKLESDIGSGYMIVR